MLHMYPSCPQRPLCSRPWLLPHTTPHPWTRGTAAEPSGVWLRWSIPRVPGWRFWSSSEPNDDRYQRLSHESDRYSVPHRRIPTEITCRVQTGQVSWNTGLWLKEVIDLPLNKIVSWDKLIFKFFNICRIILPGLYSITQFGTFIPFHPICSFL